MTILNVLLEVTLGACLVAAVIGLIRLCFRRILSPKAKYYLWALLALRLMLPALPESSLSLMNFLPQRETVTVSEPAAPVSGQSVLTQSEDTAAIWISGDATLPEEQSVPADQSISAPNTERESRPISWETVILWIWLGGMGVVLLVYLTLYAITARQLRRLPCVTDPDTLRVFLKLKRNLGLRGEVNLVSGGAGMLGGILRPTIVIPTELQGQEVAPILVHELLHYKYKDLWVSLLSRVLTAIHWFNPVVWLCFHILRNDSEAACDQRVLESDLVERQRYATVLYEEGVLQMKNSPLMQTTFGGDGRSLKRRIRLISQFRRPKVWMTVLTVVLAIIISACTLTGAQSGDADEIRDALIGAEDAFFSLGRYTSSTGDTSSLSEEEIQSQIDAFNQNMMQYFAADSVYLRGATGEEGSDSLLEYNESLLREAFSEPKNMNYIVGSGTLACDVEKLKKKDNTAEITVELVRYSTQITLSDDKKYNVRCTYTLYHRTANMVLEDGLWKVLSYDNGEGEWWDSTQYLDMENAYDTFAEALADAQSIDVIAECSYLKRKWDWVWTPEEAVDSSVTDGPDPADAVSASRELSIEDICEKAILDPEAIQTAAEAAMGMDWETYQEKLSDAIETGDYADVTLSLEGRPAYYIVHKSPDGTRTRAIRFCLEDDSQDAEAWLSYTEQITEKLSALCMEKQSVSTYRFDGGKILLEFGPVHSDDYQVHDDGTTSYAGIPSELGNRILEFSITFDSGTPSTSASLATTISPYNLETETVTYTGTNWDMTVSELIAAQELAPEIWEQTSDAQPVLHGTSPLADHPEVTDIYYRFSFKMPQLSMELFRVETHYDPSQISYETLLAQRTAELGEPTDTINAGGAIWSAGDAQLVIYNDRDGRIQEWLSVWYDRYDPTLLPNCDIDTYLAAVQPPIGRYGWTFQEHVDAGLLDPNKGTLEAINGGTAHTFATQVELGGYTLDAVYCFIETLAGQGSGREVLSEIQVDVPSDLPLSQWLARFSGSWNDRMLHQQNTWQSPMPVGSLLTEAQRDYIAEALVENAVTTTMEEAYAYLDNWSFVCSFYDTPRGWVFNGTGAALYVIATESD